MERYYPVAEPYLTGKEKEYVNQCLDSNWISSRGEFIEKFEQGFAAYCGREHGIATSNGTVSMHLILHALGIGPGDEVIVPTLTYVAALNAVLYVGATPVLVDVDPATFNIQADDIAQKITKNTKAIIVVHMYGNPCDMSAIEQVANEHNLHIIEDAAEAHGATYNNKYAGSFGTASSFSFFGNKTITTGEGGMILTNDTSLSDRKRILRGQGQHPKDPSYHHQELGFNYRMTNIQAAIGLAQLEHIDSLLEKKRAINTWYQGALKDHIASGVLIPQTPTTGSNPSYWMNAFVAPNIHHTALKKNLLVHGIETRPFFKPMHQLPYTTDNGPYPQAEYLYTHGTILPSGASLTKDDIDYITDCIKKYL